MKILLKNADLYTPTHVGVTDIVIENGKIIKIEKDITEDCESIDCQGKIICPMFVDGHEHLLGEYWNKEGIICSGVGTIVACLATETDHNYVDKLIAITNQLNKKQGLEAYCLAGSKNYVEDASEYIVNNDNVVGIKTALFQPQRPKPNLSYEKLKTDALKTYQAGLKSGKQVQVHIHLDHPFKPREKASVEVIDSGELDNLSWIDKIVEETGVPYSLFKLTHAQKYYNRILEYANKGCFIDYTAFAEEYDSRFDCLVNGIINQQVDVSKISISSDLGILTTEVGTCEQETPISLLNTMQKLVLEKGLTIEQVLPFITSNAGAQITSILGKIINGSNAKLLVLDKTLNIETVIINDRIIKTKNNLHDI